MGLTQTPPPALYVAGVPNHLSCLATACRVKALCRGAQVAQGLGLLIGTIVSVPKTAQTIASIVVLTFVLTGGYFVRGARPLCALPILG